MEMQPEHPSKISDHPKIHLTSLPGTDNGKMLRRGTPHNPRGEKGETVNPVRFPRFPFWSSIFLF